jgi:hypothetical protein
MEKLVAVMRRKSDIILITDCRLKGGAEKKKKNLGWAEVYNMTSTLIVQSLRGGYA